MMIEGLKLMFSGEELRRLLDERIEDHRRSVDRWTRETLRTPEDETEDKPLLPDHMCTNEAERYAWRAEVVQFIRDHLDPADTYRLSAADLEFGELLPSKPGWLEQDEYEERTRVGFNLERLVRAVERLAVMAPHMLWKDDEQPATPAQPGIIEETDERAAIPD